MLSKNELKRLSKYKQDKHRRQDGLFIVEGVKMVEELLQSEFEILLLCAVSSWLEENMVLVDAKLHRQVTVSEQACGQLGEASAESATPFLHKHSIVNEVTEEELQKISLLSTPNRVYCLVKRPEVRVNNSLRGLTLMLDGIKDPGNLGTIVRLADWYAIDRLVCSKDCVDVFNPKTVQATMGSVFRVQAEYVELEAMLQSIPADYPVYGSLVEEGSNIYSQTLPADAILIIGSESHGISPQVRRYILRSVSIPRFSAGDKPESLNAGVATAIMLSEFKRGVSQR